MAAVPPIWRIASLIALGLLMLGVGAVYLRLSAKIGTAPGASGAHSPGPLTFTRPPPRP